MTEHGQLAEKRLMEKMTREWEQYIDKLKQMPFEEIIRRSNETVFKEDIIALINNSMIPARQIRELLALKTPLEDLCDHLSGNDVFAIEYLDSARHSIRLAVSEVLKEHRKDRARDDAR